MKPPEGLKLTPPTWLDRAVAFISPRAGVERAKARFALDLAARHYEGAGTGRRFAGWRAPASDANTAGAGQLGRLRDRCRDTVRNNGWGRRALRARAQNVVGGGIVAKWVSDRPDDPRLPRIRALWKAWALSTEIDAERRRDFYGMQRLAVRSIVESGEILFRRRFRRPQDGLTIPLQIQALEADHIDDTKDGDQNDRGFVTRNVQGVNFNAIGQRLGYWLFPEHPGSNYRPTFQSVFVPDEEILHVYEAWRPGQVRGVPALAPCVLLLRDLDEYEDASLVKAKVAAMFSAFVYRPRDPDADTPGASAAADGTPIETLEPGTVEYLREGEDVRFANPPTVEGYDEFTAGKLRKVAAAIGITFEQLTQDYSRVNFTSGRMGWIENALEVSETRWDVLDPLFLSPISRWFLELVELRHGISTEGISVEWTEPAREMLDPTREVAAKIKAVRGGLRSLSDTIRGDGYDPDTVLQEIAEERKKCEELEIKLETNPEDDANAQAGDTTGDPATSSTDGSADAGAKE